MVIGQDFEKITYEFLGFNLLEPNALVGDLLIAILALFLAYKTSSLAKSSFVQNWTTFFALLGLSFLVGGLGHTFYSYWGVSGKYFSWFTSIIFLYFLERALIVIDIDIKRARIFTKLSQIKLIVFLGLEVVVITKFDIESNPHYGLIIPSLSTLTSMLLFNILLGIQFTRQIHHSFIFLSLAVVVMLPAAVAQSMKISLNPLFDRNDISHICVFIMLLLYWQTVNKYSNRVTKSHIA